MDREIMVVLFEWPTWLIVIGLLIAMVACNELGYRIGLRTSQSETDLSRSASSALKGTIFALVALLLAFSFSATTSRHEIRQRVVLDQANAIGTCYQRAGLLDEPARTRIRDILRSYLDVRLRHLRAGFDRQIVDQTNAEIVRLLAELDAETTKAFRQNADIVHKSMLVPAVNEVCDLSTTRAWAGRNHLPDPVLILLLAGVLISSLLIGHSSGQATRRHLGLWCASNVVFSLVLFVVLDFDRPRRGLIKVDHAPLIELQAAIGDPSQ